MLIKKIHRKINKEILNLKQNIRDFISVKIMFAFFGKALPRQNVIIDPINMCNLKCPLCPTGSDKLNYPRGRISIEQFKLIIERMPSLKSISLYNWGEPFLNSEIFEIIKYAENKKIATMIHSNFSLKKDDGFFKKIIDSGLNQLIISLDGASQESYEKYRKGGNFELVINNLRKLQTSKKSLSKLKPNITWKYIVNKYNEHEIEIAKKMAKELEINFETVKMGLGDDLPDVNFDESFEKSKESWLPKDAKYIDERYLGKHSFPLYDSPCNYLFSSLVINHDGDVFPCCFVSDKRYSFGNIFNESFSNIWNNKTYLYSRKLFYFTFARSDKIESICSDCYNFKKRFIN